MTELRRALSAIEEAVDHEVRVNARMFKEKFGQNPGCPVQAARDALLARLVEAVEDLRSRVDALEPGVR